MKRYSLCCASTIEKVRRAGRDKIRCSACKKEIPQSDGKVIRGNWRMPGDRV